MSDLCSSELTQGSCVPRYTAFGRTRHERAGRAAHVQSSLRTQQRRHVQPSLRAQRRNPVAPPDQATHPYRPFIPSAQPKATCIEGPECARRGVSRVLPPNPTTQTNKEEKKD